MTYFEYIHKVQKNVLVYDEDNKFWYIDPDWRYLLKKSNITPELIGEDIDINLDEVKEVLMLETERRNKALRSLPNILNDIMDIISSDETLMGTGNDEIE